MRVLIISLFIAGMYLLPLYLFDNLVLPQIQAIQGVYERADTVAESIAQSN